MTDVIRQMSRPQQGAGGPPVRVPPQNLEAERSLLGAMLLSRDAIGMAIESVGTDDFYRPLHGRIFEAVLTLYGRGEPVDAVTLAEALRQEGVLEELGGLSYLRALTADVPATSSAGYYAEIVANTAILRRLIETSGEIADLAYDPSADPKEVLDAAEAQVFEIGSERARGETLVPLNSLLDEQLDRLEELHSQGTGVTGLETGFRDFDKLTAGLQPSNVVIVAARPGMGKALALDTPLPTPQGWTTMGEVGVGDWLLGSDGRPTRVLAASEVQQARPCYEIEFSEGSRIVADADHLWQTETRACRQGFEAPAVRTTREICETLECETADRRFNHSIPLRHTHEGRITTGDVEIIQAIELAGNATSRQLAKGATRKLSRQVIGDLRPSTRRLFIVGIRAVAPRPVRCVQVDAADHLYLAGRGFVPTHNSTFIANVAQHVSLKQAKAVAFFTLEMSKMEVVSRLLCAQARVEASKMKTGRLSDGDWAQLAQAVGQLSEAPLFIDDSGHLTVLDVRAKCRRLASRQPLGLIVIDYLQLMHGSGRVESRQVEISEISRGLKILARELDVPVIAACQLNRSPEARADKRPLLGDLRESGSLEQDSDIVAFLYRDDYYNADSPARGEAELIVAKHRNGPTDTIRLAFLEHNSRFDNLSYREVGV